MNEEKYKDVINELEVEIEEKNVEIEKLEAYIAEILKDAK